MALLPELSPLEIRLVRATVFSPVIVFAIGEWSRSRSKGLSLSVVQFLTAVGRLMRLSCIVLNSSLIMEFLKRRSELDLLYFLHLFFQSGITQLYVWYSRLDFNGSQSVLFDKRPPVQVPSFQCAGLNWNQDMIVDGGVVLTHMLLVWLLVVVFAHQYNVASKGSVCNAFLLLLLFFNYLQNFERLPNLLSNSKYAYSNQFVLFFWERCSTR